MDDDLQLVSTLPTVFQVFNMLNYRKVIKKMNPVLNLFVTSPLFMILVYWLKIGRSGSIWKAL